MEPKTRLRIKKRTMEMDEQPFWEKAAAAFCERNGEEPPKLLSDQGSFSVVYRCGTDMALKVIDYQRAARHLNADAQDHDVMNKIRQLTEVEMCFLQEVSCLEEGSHSGQDYLPVIYEANQDILEGREYAYIAMELLQPIGIGLKEEPVVLRIGIEMASALDYVHNHSKVVQGGAYRDMKPDNIMRRKKENQTVFVLADFNALGGNLSGTRMGATVIGTPSYLPIEVLLPGKSSHGADYSNKSDLYSLSATLYEFLNEAGPPPRKCPDGRFNYTQEFEKPKTGSLALKKFLVENLRLYKEDRPCSTAEEYKDQLMAIQYFRGVEEYEKMDNAEFPAEVYLEPFAEYVEKDADCLKRNPACRQWYQHALEILAAIAFEEEDCTAAEDLLKKARRQGTLQETGSRVWKLMHPEKEILLEKTMEERIEEIMNPAADDGIREYRFSNGTRYTGRMVDGKYQGSGVLILPKGTRYEGDFDKGLLRWGKITYIDGTVYEGELNEKRQPDGLGRMTWPNGEFHEGVYVNGHRHGYGTGIWASGGSYEGEFENGDLKCGKINFADGTVYEGEIADGKITENGTCRTADNELSKGSYTALHLLLWAGICAAFYYGLTHQMFNLAQELPVILYASSSALLLAVNLWVTIERKRNLMELLASGILAVTMIYLLLAWDPLIKVVVAESAAVLVSCAAGIWKEKNLKDGLNDAKWILIVIMAVVLWGHMLSDWLIK